mgnify:CR=1 FL=1
MTPNTNSPRPEEVVRLVNIAWAALEQAMSDGHQTTANEILSTLLALVSMSVEAVRLVDGNIEGFREPFARLYALLPPLPDIKH